jgi:hypothetical protein
MTNTGATPGPALDSSEIAPRSRAWRDLLQGLTGLQVPDAVTKPLYQGLDALATAGDALTKAQADASALEMNSTLEWRYRLTTGKSGITKALDATDSAHSALRTTTGSVRDRVRALVLPGAAGAGDAMQALAATQVIEYLKTSGNEAELRERVAELLTEALANGDETAAGILFSLPLREYYRRVNVNLTALYQRVQRARREAAGNDVEIPGANLLPMLESGEFIGFLNSVGMTLYRTRQDTEARYAQLGRDWSLRAGYGWVQK